MNRKEIENILKDYHWMINSIKIMRQSLEGAGEGLTAQYGDEADMPKAKGQTSDPIYSEVIRRGKRWEKVEGYEQKVKAIQSRIHVISDEREYEVLHWLLEGKSYRWIGQHMGWSFSHIKRIRDSIIDKLANGTYGTNDTNGTYGTNLHKEKSAC